MKTTVMLGACVLAAVSALGGCVSTTSTPPLESSASSEANAYGGFAIDPPAADEVVLTITADRVVEFTYAELQDLATVEITILEPFVDEQQSFTGVPLADLLAQAGVPLGSRIETVALNDYAYSDVAAEWVDNNALLAVFRDGEPIPMDQGGPIRIVFADDSAAYDVLDAWNWSLRLITVID